jgi:GNAT superfamily N-acetyltransferase
MSGSSYTVRLAAPGEVAALPAIERSAARLFRDSGLRGDFLDRVREVDELDPAQREGRLWVAVSPDGTPVGFALATVLGTAPHLEEIDVHPEHGRQGLGTRLVAAVVAWARARNATALTLSTFRDVPWNAPFYARLGFRMLEPEALGAELRGLVAREAAAGLPVERRCVMRLELASDA